MKKQVIITMTLFIAVCLVVTMSCALIWARTTTFKELSAEYQTEFAEGVEFGLVKAGMEDVPRQKKLVQTMMNNLTVWEAVELMIFKNENVAWEMATILEGHCNQYKYDLDLESKIRI